MRNGGSATVWVRKLGDCWFVVALSNEGKLVGSTFSRIGESDVRTSLYHDLRMYDRVESQSDSHADRLIQTLHEMYQGKPASLDVELDMRFVTPFHRTVYRKTGQIPRGQVTTYGLIARSLGSVQLSRAVGHANAANPFVLVVPCHRVVPWTLEVGNYGRGPQLKRELLKREGVSFEGVKVSESSIWTPPQG